MLERPNIDQKEEGRQEDDEERQEAGRWYDAKWGYSEREPAACRGDEDNEIHQQHGNHACKCGEDNKMHWLSCESCRVTDVIIEF